MADIIDLTDTLDEAIGHAIVTGADSGIGKAAAVQLAAAGFDVGITWHTDAEGAEETAREIQVHGRRALLRQVDLTVLPDAADVIDDLALELGVSPCSSTTRAPASARRSSTRPSTSGATPSP